MNKVTSTPKEGSPIPAGINNMRSAGFAHLGLDELLLPTAQHFPGQCSASQSYSRLKSLIKWKTKKRGGDTFPESITPLCTEEMPPHGGQVGFGPAAVHSLPVVTGCPNRTISTAPRKQHNWNWTGAALATGQQRSQGRVAWAGNRLLVRVTPWQGQE